MKLLIVFLFDTSYLQCIIQKGKQKTYRIQITEANHCRREMADMIFCNRVAGEKYPTPRVPSAVIFSEICQHTCVNFESVRHSSSHRVEGCITMN